MTVGFSYPTAAELQSWATDLGRNLDPSQARALRRRLTWSVHLFTKSILVALPASLLCAVLAVQASGRHFWVLYGAAVLIPLVAAYAYRSALATVAPELAVRYYLTVLLNRLQRWESSAGDLGYLRAVVPPLEDALLGSALTRRLAGSQGAQTGLRTRVAAVTQELGRAEGRLLDVGQQDRNVVASNLRATLGRLLVAVQLRDYSALPASGTSDVAPAVPEATPSLLTKLIDKAISTGWGAIVSAAAVVLVPIAKRFEEGQAHVVAVALAVAVGLTWGVVMRLVRPGRQTQSIASTLALAVLGALFGTAAVALIGGEVQLGPQTLLAQVVGAIVVVTVVNLAVDRQALRGW